MTTFLLELRFDRDNDHRLAVRAEHREYLQRLHEDGTLVMAGPYTDQSGALLVFRAESQAALEALLEGDPYTREDVVTRVAIREWTVLFPPE